MTLEEAREVFDHIQGREMNQFPEYVENYILALEAQLSADAKYTELGRRVMEMPSRMVFSKFGTGYRVTGSDLSWYEDPNEALKAAGVLLPEERG